MAITLCEIDKTLKIPQRIEQVQEEEKKKLGFLAFKKITTYTYRRYNKFYACSW